MLTHGRQIMAIKKDRLKAKCPACGSRLKSYDGKKTAGCNVCTWGGVILVQSNTIKPSNPEPKSIWSRLKYLVNFNRG